MLPLLVALFTVIVYIGSLNVISATAAGDASPATVTSSSDWTVTPAQVAYVPPSFSSFYTCIFGVKLFPGADPVGTYSINNNPYYVPTPPSGGVSGHVFLISRNNPMPGTVLYLRSLDDGTSGSYYAISDNRGYYGISRVPFGNYSVYACYDLDSMQAGSGELVGSVELTDSNPNAIVDWQVMPVW